MVPHLKNNRSGGKAVKQVWYIHWIWFDQEWKLRLSEEDAHPRSKGAGSWLRHGYCHVKGSTKEVIGGPHLLNKQNQWWTCRNVNWERFFCEKHERQYIAWCCR